MFRTQWLPQMKPSKSTVKTVILDRAQEHAQGGKRRKRKKISGEKSQDQKPKL